MFSPARYRLAASGDLSAPSSPSWVVSSTESSILEANAPTAADIAAAFRSVNLGPTWGSWLGPVPRVTRTAPLGSFRTVATWVWTMPDTPWTAQHSSYVLGRVQAALADALHRGSSDWSAPTVAPYDVANNGPAAFWQSGSAGVTQTRDTFPTGGGRLDAPENPMGPTTDATHPTSLGQGLSTISSPLTGAAKLITTIAVVAGVGVAGWYAWPVISGTRPRAAT